MSDRACAQIARRGIGWSLLALAAFGALAWRLWCIQVVDHEQYRRRADETSGRRWPIAAPRGNIYDRSGNPLALNLKLFSVAADPALIRDPDKVAAELAPLLRQPPTQILHKLRARPGARWVSLRETVDEPLAEAVKGLDRPGVIVARGWKRAYPHGPLAGPVVGFVGRDMKGLAGIEAALDARLSGVDGQVHVVLDGRRPSSREAIPSLTMVTEDMTPGASVVLTIDLDIQAIAEEELRRGVEAAAARGGTAVVMDPATGEVLALATYPGFDPNEYAEYPPSTWVSDAVVAPYEPGSTFKVFTACAALEEGLMSSGERYRCTGTRSVGSRTISCTMQAGTRAHGEVDLDTMVVKSCNVGMATVALRLGAKRMHEWARRFGFGVRTGIELAGESPGLLSPPERWSEVQLANVGFGQGVSVTPLQLLSAYCAVANGGLRVRPHIVALVREADGTVTRREPEPGERLLSEATCRRVNAMLERAVTEGTGRRAAVEGRRVAGKTGTAQKAVPGRGYAPGKYVSSFVGHAPVRRPRVAILVVVDEPQGQHYGGLVAAPVFRAICERTLTHLRVPPESAEFAGRSAAERRG